MFKFLYTFLIFCLCLSANGQDSGQDVFDNSFLHEVRIQFDNNNFFETLKDNYDIYYPDVPYVMADVSFDGEIVDSIGVRFKGFSSYWGSQFKKSIKLDMNEFVKGKKLDGLKKLNLNNGEGDPSFNRDFLCFDMMRQNGVRAPRVAYAKVYLNDTYWGLYSIVEQIDDTFLENNFADGSGNLFKNIGWTELLWNGSSPNNYADEIGLKTNEDENDWSGFIEFLDILNNTSNTVFQSEIGDIFNVNLFLKTLAIDVVTNNWDSYMEHGRNFFIYEEPGSDQFQWIPWDYNLAMGGTFAGGFGGECDFFVDFVPFISANNVIEFQDNTWPQPQSEVYWDFGDGNNSTEPNPTHTYENSGVYNVCLYADYNGPCEQIACKLIDTNDLPENCNSILNGSCPYPPDDPVFQEVIAFAPNCCDGSWTPDCQDLYDFFDDQSGGGGLNNFPIDMEDSGKILISRLMNIPEYRDEYYRIFCNILKDNFTEERIFPMVDHNSQLIRDAVYEDDNYIWSTNAFEMDLDQGTNQIPGMRKFVTERIPALQEELEELFDCSLVIDLNYQDVVINEFMASNAEGGESDNEGEFDDWIEIHNNTNLKIDLSDFAINDTSTYDDAWKFPPGTEISPNGYLIVWADNDVNQAGLHTHFKLSKSGEQIYLFNGSEIIDNHIYGEQETLVSSARVPNGTGNFIKQSATFGFNNEGSSVNDLDLGEIRVFPNPGFAFVNVAWEKSLNSDIKIDILDQLGRVVLSTLTTEAFYQIDVRHFSSGMYFIRLSDENSQWTEKIQIIRE